MDPRYREPTLRIVDREFSPPSEFRSELSISKNVFSIDQQAAESLGKSEKSLSDAQFDLEESHRSPGSKPLIKEQLKRKAPAYYAANQATTTNAENQIPEVLSRSNSDIEGKDGVTRNRNSKSHVIGELPNNDWTELLTAPPDRRRLSIKQAGSRASSLVSRSYAPYKDGKKAGSGGGSEIAKINGAKHSEKLDTGSENVDSGKLKNDDDVLGRASSTRLPQPETEPESITVNSVSDTTTEANTQLTKDAVDMDDESRRNRMDDLEHYSGLNPISRPSFSTNLSSATEKDEESNSTTESSSSSDSEVEKEGGKSSQQTLGARESARAIETIKKHENLVAMLEGEKLSLEKILEEQTRQQVKEASELQTLMMETMEAVELEKQKHNNTRMEAFARLAKLEAVNADLGKSLANAQKKLEIEVDRIAELRRQIYVKEATNEELQRKPTLLGRNDDGKVRGSKLAGYETGMLESEYSFTAEKVRRLQEQVSVLETTIQRIRSEMESPTNVEIELKARLGQLTDLLIQKQAQVETLISEKAMLFLKIEHHQQAVSKLVEENRTTASASSSSTWRDDLLPNRPKLNERMKRSRQQLGSLVRLLDSLFVERVLRRSRRGRMWALVYLVCLHFWVIYIFMSSHSSIPEPGSVVARGGNN
ncbi:hypothetical protein M569_00968 [Genlisea aurea]|uniref:Golgin-84 n=1 Tax=Genlisea aurea TaxID=192259 RepID=S8D321_9LAMI|nr:hypothetical protein M569_00968 [Genlisea aurea]